MSVDGQTNTIVFAIVVGDEVAGTISYGIDDARPVIQRQIAAMLSDPKIVECTSIEGIRFGWKWDGKTFSKPD